MVEITVADFRKSGEAVRSEEECKALLTLIVIPLSMTLVDDAKPYRMRISRREDKLKNDSDAYIYEIRELAKTWLKEKVAQLISVEHKEMKWCLRVVV